MNRLYSHGKLLLTGEYVVLDGAKSLALPTRFGQYMTFNNVQSEVLHWQSIDHRQNIWFEDSFKVVNDTFISLSSTSNDISMRLVEILNFAYELNPKFIEIAVGSQVITQLEFPNNWGLGTSSTLINNISRWADIDPYQLLKLTFGGSGYDIACASANGAIIYQNSDDQPTVKSVDFNPVFKECLYFVHLNEKQNSREGIAHYRNSKMDLTTIIGEINFITQAMVDCKELGHFQTLLNKHEAIISNCVQLDTVKNRLFNDFNGSIKSLGAWGGDFILVASNNHPKAYFESKGYPTILSYSDMILN